MAKPVPTRIDPKRVPELALATIQAAPFPQLASMDGDQARLRPVSPVATEGFTIYVANLRSYHKTGEIAANPKVELCYLDADHNQVRITGLAHIEERPEKLETIWAKNPLLRQFVGSLDNPELVVYRIEPTRVRYMQEWAAEYFEVPLDPANPS